jgi:hypothetical protein
MSFKHISAFLAFVVVLAVAAPAQSQDQTGAQSGVVKTLTDSDIGSLKLRSRPNVSISDANQFSALRISAQQRSKAMSALPDESVINTAVVALGDVVLTAAEEKTLAKAQALVVQLLDDIKAQDKDAEFTGTRNVLATYGIKKLIIDPDPLMQQIAVDLLEYYAKNNKSDLANVANALGAMSVAIALPSVSTDEGSSFETATRKLLQAVKDVVSKLPSDPAQLANLTADQKAAIARAQLYTEVIKEFLDHRNDTVEALTKADLKPLALSLINAYQYKTNQSYSDYLKTVAVIFISFANNFMDDYNGYKNDIPIVKSALVFMYAMISNNGKPDPETFLNSIDALMKPLLQKVDDKRAKKAIRVITVAVDYSREYSTSYGDVDAKDKAKAFLVSEATKDMKTVHLPGAAVLALSGYAAIDPVHLNFSGALDTGSPLALDLGISLQWYADSKAGVLLAWSPLQLGQYIKLQTDLSVDSSVDAYSAFNPLSFAAGAFFDAPIPFIVALRVGKYSNGPVGSDPEWQASILIGVHVSLFELYDF